MKQHLQYFAGFLSIILFPNFLFSQTAPNLNTAASYVLFTGNGEFTSTSSSTNVSGNVGNVVGAVNAFPLGNLTGTKHFGDAASVQADSDIVAAYADLVSKPCDFVHGVGFGSNETLTPGVYCSSAASTMNGNLNLDAGGNPNAVFIIKIDGAFSAASGSQIVLSNLASACNVYWQINGVVDLDNTVFKGTMLVNGAISLNAGTRLTGRALTKTGALIFASIQASVCNLGTLSSGLQFEVNKTRSNGALISWLNASENNLSRYEIEASTNGTTFSTIGVIALRGSNVSTPYVFEENLPNNAGTHFYRLKMVSNTGVFTYSEVKSIQFSNIKVGLVSIFPNPAINSINLTVYAESKESILLRITNMQGQIIRNKTVIVNKGLNNVEEDVRSLAKTRYEVSVENVKTGAVSRESFQKL